MSDDYYCIKCGHYPEVSFIRVVECECDCHGDKSMFYGDSRDDNRIEKK